MLDLIRKLLGGGDRGAANDWRPAPSCSIYLRDDAVIVLTGRSTETGLGIAGEPVWRLDPSPDPAALTRAIHDALKASATAVPVALSEDLDLIPRTTGLRSWVAMERGAKRLSVRSEGGAFHLETWKPAGGGWEGDGSRTLNAPSADRLGHEVLQLAASAAPRPPARVRRPRRYSAPQAPTNADVPVAFGYKAYWLTVASPDPRPVADALRLTDLRPLPWRDGYVAASDAFMDLAYVTPSVEGWVFAVFAEVPEDEDGLRAVLEPLSDRFDEAQAFINVRTSSAYGWARAEGGRLIRAFIYGDGEFRLNVGAPTPEEAALEVGMPDDEQPPDEEDVLKVAEQWSINPLDLGDQPTYGTGLLGRKERRRQ